MDYLILKWINNLAGQWEGLDMFGIICADSLIFAIPLIIILVYFLSSRRKQFSLIALKIILAAGLAYLLNYLIGLVLPRQRPYLTHRNIYELIGFLASPTDLSFPSDHTAIAFVMAFSVLLRWRKFAIILLIIAALVGLSRIFAGVHWPSDVLVGIVVAGISVFVINTIFKRLWRL